MKTFKIVLELIRTQGEQCKFTQAVLRIWGIIQNQVIGVTPLVLSQNALCHIICTESEVTGFANIYNL